MAVVLAGCGASASNVSQGDAPAPSSILTGTQSEQQESDSATRTEVLPTLQDLEDLIDTTVSAPRMSFTLAVTMSMPGSSSPIVAHRTGSFDDSTFAGVGTRSFGTDDEALAELWGEEPFEFIVTDEVLWMYNPLAEPPEWAGFDLFEFAQFAGGDPLGSVDVDGYLSVIVGAATEIVEVLGDAGSGRTWVVRVRSDELVPLVAAAGPASRLVETGAAESGIMAELQIQQSPEGYVAAIRGDLSTWWTNALMTVDDLQGLVGDETMEMDLQLEPFAPALQPDAPCLDPASEIDEGLTVLSCEGG